MDDRPERSGTQLEEAERELADAECEGLPGWHVFTSNGKQKQPTLERIRRYHLGQGTLEPFPPGPADLDNWRDIIITRPDLAPAVSQAEAEAECQLRRLAYELDPWVDRVERLRGGGNGVVSLQAAYAAVVLVASLRARCLRESAGAGN